MTLAPIPHTRPALPRPIPSHHPPTPYPHPNPPSSLFCIGIGLARAGIVGWYLQPHPRLRTCTMAASGSFIRQVAQPLGPSAVSDSR